MSRFLLVSGATALVVLLLMVVTAAVARRAGRVSVIDVAWGIGFVLTALIGLVLGDGSGLRRVVVLVMVGVWGLRLAVHIGRKASGQGEDPRYRELLARKPSVWRAVFIPQGVSIWFVSLPVQVIAVQPGRLGVVAWLGVALWAVGFLFEGVGDAQLAAYKKDPNRGPVMDRGLWAWTRHPNYFGDACVWWGIWLVAADAWPGVLTVLSPVVMTYFLVFATGARLLEKTMMQRPGYPEYAARTSSFLPRPPRRRTQ